MFSLLGVHAIRSAIQLQERALELQCLNDCTKNITAITDCQNNTTCFCNLEYTPIIQHEKCLYDCSEPEDWHPRPANLTVPTDQCGATTPPPNGTRATRFNLIGCASGCLTTTNIPSCSDFPSTDCTCNLMNTPSDQAVQSAFRLNKCVADMCNEHDTAVAYTQLEVDCGFWSASTPASQLKWPYNKFKAVYDASTSGAALHSPGGLIAVLTGTVLGIWML
jgi:hypothetical protein